MGVNINLLDFIQIMIKKKLKSELFMLILCIVWNNCNYVEVIVFNVNLLNFTDTVDVMSHGSDA